MNKLFYNYFISLLILLLGTVATVAQQIISGTVVDENSFPVIGAAVLVKGTTIGTVTDIDGSYNLNIPSDDVEIEVSYIGFSTQTVRYDDGSYANITLSESSTSLDEVVITGLASSIKRSNLANAVASISAKELTGVTTQNTIDGALYGKFKGADIRANSGAPGGGFSILSLIHI